MNIAIITARGGSKRIPKKNIKEFCGKPIIAYSIEAALQSGVFDEVMVSTDCEEIANVSEKYGAKVPFYRSEKNSSDYAATKDVLLEVLSEYQDRGLFFERMACIYPTAPFITAEKLRLAEKMMISQDASEIISVVPFSYPPQRAYIVKNDKLYYKSEEYRMSRSQDLEQMYHDAGQFYFYRVNDFIANNGIIVENKYPFILPEVEVQDIDNQSDWELAELKYKIMESKNR